MHLMSLCEKTSLFCAEAHIEHVSLRPIANDRQTRCPFCSQFELCEISPSWFENALRQKLLFGRKI